MTWEELAKFIMEMPEEERKRPAFRIRAGFVVEIKYGRNLNRLTDESNTNAPGFVTAYQKGDWVIE